MINSSLLRAGIGREEMPTSVIKNIRRVADDGVGASRRRAARSLRRSSRRDAPLPRPRSTGRPMLWALPPPLSHHDAEDAFQATFIVLVRTGFVHRSGGWRRWKLAAKGSAHKAALQARGSRPGGGRREVQVREMPEPRHRRTVGRPANHCGQELSRLPDHLPGPHRPVRPWTEDAQRRLRSARLSRRHGGEPVGAGRAMLAKRLRQRGIVLSGGGVAAVCPRTPRRQACLASVVMSNASRPRTSCGRAKR